MGEMTIPTAYSAVHCRVRRGSFLQLIFRILQQIIRALTFFFRIYATLSIEGF